MPVAATHVGECRQEGWSSRLLLFQSSSGRRAQSLLGKQRSWRWCVLAWDPTSVTSASSLPQPPIKLSMLLLPVQRAALGSFVWTAFAPSLSSAAPRVSTLGSPGSERLRRPEELATVSRRHGGRRYGQSGGHGDGLWLRPHQREHPCDQSGDHRVLQVSPFRCCWCCVCVRVWEAPRVLEPCSFLLYCTQQY